MAKNIVKAIFWFMAGIGCVMAGKVVGGKCGEAIADIINKR